MKINNHFCKFILVTSFHENRSIFFIQVGTYLFTFSKYDVIKIKLKIFEKNKLIEIKID